MCFFCYSQNQIGALGAMVSFLIAHSKFLHEPRSHVPPLRGSTRFPHSTISRRQGERGFHS